jgi:hypothetical protein
MQLTIHIYFIGTTPPAPDYVILKYLRSKYKTVTTSSLANMQEHSTQAVTQLFDLWILRVHSSSILHSMLHHPVHILILILMLVLPLTYH